MIFVDSGNGWICHVAKFLSWEVSTSKLEHHLEMKEFWWFLRIDVRSLKFGEVFEKFQDVYKRWRTIKPGVTKFDKIWHLQGCYAGDHAAES